ncbi:MAG: PAS domain S-box protein [Proteobacteria bacterium]|nr:PAS domain S-box protein [Pseudomonadota bacterium]MBU1388105.1 PAS domain S-box protein [Pseudomonadota bacterium]MBU1542169.1 PAS domain S-box protein [Pseudomonadota bacterium]MBU2481675.1 PAS domain S-box protein [Pseudomonadota bacterium]
MKKPSSSRSLRKQFQRDYFIISVILVLFFFALLIGGATLTRKHMTGLIAQSTRALNTDAEKNLQALGEKIIQAKAGDVARQIEIYFRMNPLMTIEEMLQDPYFKSISLQKVGTAGYTAVYEAPSCIFRVHPDPETLNRDMSYLKDKLPSWWKIVGATLEGKEASGYYNWIDPDNQTRKKYMTVMPIAIPLNGQTMMVAATSYIDEFSAPVKLMETKAQNIVRSYRQYVTRQGIVFCIIAAMISLVAFYGVYRLGTRASLKYILPIMQLADITKDLGRGKWEISGHEYILERKDEIGTLAKALDRMSNQLKILFSNIEKRVLELHTVQKALKESEEHYRTLYEESRRAEELYQSLINSSADAIAIYDLESRIKYISPTFTKIFGWTQEELVGKPLHFTPESEQPKTNEIARNVIQNGIPFQGFETQRITKNDQLIDISLSTSRYDDHKGNPAGVLVILRDISEKKQIEAQLQHIERMEAIGTLAGGIAHDFNNLLMVIQGNITKIQYDITPEHPNYKDLTHIEKQVERGASLTRQLLGYARKGQYEVCTVNLNLIIRENAQTFWRTRKNISIHYDLSENLSLVDADASQIEQVLMNLFINASDVMPESGTLFLTTRNVTQEEMVNKPYIPKSSNYVLLEVKDTGTGMDQKTMEKIFNPFFTTKEMGRGTGLGLASAYGIIKAHDGYIDVTSQKGTGTTFHIYLPISKKSPGPTPDTRVQTIFHGTETILLVDDEPIVLEAGADMLDLLGYTVLTAENGKKAIDIYQNNKDRIDLVLLDMIMPDMGGGIVFDRLREINPDVCIILSSGYSVEGKATDIMNRGCNGFIQKPYTIEAISKKIKSTMNRRMDGICHEDHESAGKNETGKGIMA